MSHGQDSVKEEGSGCDKSERDSIREVGLPSQSLHIAIVL